MDASSSHGGSPRLQEDASVVEEIREWKQRGTSFRPRLLSYRDLLREELLTVEDLLSELDRAEGVAAPASTLADTESSLRLAVDPWVQEMRVRNLSDADLVLAVVVHENAWIGSQRVLEVGRAVNSGLTNERVFSALYRLSKSERILARGTRGSKEYAPLDLEEELELTD